MQEQLKFDDNGLIPAIVQDRLTGEVRMVAWMNRPALAATLHSRVATFFSRSRGKLWVKGETSGHVLRVAEVQADCDGDTLLILVDPEGPSCHTGRRNCFFTPLQPIGAAPGAVDAPTLARAPLSEALPAEALPAEALPAEALPAEALPAEALAAASELADQAETGPFLWRLEDEIQRRTRSAAERSYTKYLLERGVSKINEKIQEEAGELAQALAGESSDRVASEAADVLYHVMVGLRARGVSLRDVVAVLAARAGQSGHAEKASRRAPGAPKGDGSP